jgi:hypothetical protein
LCWPSRWSVQSLSTRAAGCPGPGDDVVPSIEAPSAVGRNFKVEEPAKPRRAARGVPDAAAATPARRLSALGPRKLPAALAVLRAPAFAPSRLRSDVRHPRTDGRGAPRHTAWPDVALSGGAAVFRAGSSCQRCAVAKLPLERRASTPRGSSGDDAEARAPASSAPSSASTGPRRTRSRSADSW